MAKKKRKLSWNYTKYTKGLKYFSFKVPKEIAEEMPNGKYRMTMELIEEFDATDSTFHRDWRLEK